MILISSPLLLYGGGIILLLVYFVLALIFFVGLPSLILWHFFHSTRIPRKLKDIIGAILGALLLLGIIGGGGLYLFNRQLRLAEEWRERAQPIRLTIQQPGLLPYPLGMGGIEQARYDTVRLLVVSGVLPDGRLLRARLEASTGYSTPNETNVVTVTIKGKAAMQATGRSVYDPGSQTVSGEFQCVLPSRKRITCSFLPTPVMLHYRHDE